MRLVVYMDPYGRFYLSERRSAYAVVVEVSDGYQVLEDNAGKKTLVGPEGSFTEITQVLRSGLARIL